MLLYFDLVTFLHYKSLYTAVSLIRTNKLYQIAEIAYTVYTIRYIIKIFSAGEISFTLQ